TVSTGVGSQTLAISYASAGASAAAHAGNYAITGTLSDGTGLASDYDVTLNAGTLTVTPAALTITADDKTKVYGAGLPALTASYAGFVNGDTSASLTTQPTLSTTATAASHAGTYAITAAGAADSDYAITYQSGT